MPVERYKDLTKRENEDFFLVWLSGKVYHSETGSLSSSLTVNNTFLAGISLGMTLECPRIDFGLLVSPRTYMKIKAAIHIRIMLEVMNYNLAFPKRKKKLYASKPKEFPDDNFELNENGGKLSKQVENTKGKGEIARYEQFLLFPQCFQKTCTADTSNCDQGLFGKGLRHSDPEDRFLFLNSRFLGYLRCTKGNHSRYFRLDW